MALSFEDTNGTRGTVTETLEVEYAGSGKEDVEDDFDADRKTVLPGVCTPDQCSSCPKRHRSSKSNTPIWRKTGPACSVTGARLWPSASRLSEYPS